jgi:sugar phosphate isomerase/epimerase
MDISVITSCLWNWKLEDLIPFLSLHRVSKIDLYCFRDIDLQTILPGEQGIPPYERIQRINMQDVSKRISNVLKSGGGKQPLKVASLTTYYSAITSPDENLRNRTVSILERLIYLADSLKTKCIEIVCGARAFGSSSKEGEYSVQRRMPLMIESDLLSAMLKLRQAAEKKGVHFAFEIEPGPTFALNNLKEAIEIVCRLREKVGDFVGLNIDIGHMIMSGEKPSTLSKHKDLIFHSHISDNAESHYADLIPGTYHYSEFRDWLTFLHEVEEEGNDDFTNCVALELEACPSPDWVLLSLEKIRQLEHEVRSKM